MLDQIDRPRAPTRAPIALFCLTHVYRTKAVEYVQFRTKHPRLTGPNGPTQQKCNRDNAQRGSDIRVNYIGNFSSVINRVRGRAQRGHSEEAKRYGT
jgi:hypothetical protein